jgi:hypothetical protein
MEDWAEDGEGAVLPLVAGPPELPSQERSTDNAAAGMTRTIRFTYFGSIE